MLLQKSYHHAIKLNVSRNVALIRDREVGARDTRHVKPQRRIVGVAGILELTLPIVKASENRGSCTFRHGSLSPRERRAFTTP